MLDENDELVPPNLFIQAAERFHLISTLDRWVVRTALDQLSQPDNLCGDASIAINLSGQSLSESRFLDFVLNQLEVSGADPNKLCFEITETATVGNLERAKRFMRSLTEKGCRFILDDFGSGLSSFAYLKNLEVELLKIDREFTKNVIGDPVQAAIINSIRQIGHVMGFEVIGEGVETEAALIKLRDLGLDYAQGFYIQRPEPWWLGEF
jgi:EAL domain-containing protein (putative c-di-GMP-specific phosphodiesterase class I)